MDFPIRDRAVLDTPRHDEQLAGAEPHVAVAQLNGQLTSNDDEQLIGVVVGVPDELTTTFGDQCSENNDSFSVMSTASLAMSRASHEATALTSPLRRGT